MARANPRPLRRVALLCALRTVLLPAVLLPAVSLRSALLPAVLLALAVPQPASAQGAPAQPPPAQAAPAVPAPAAPAAEPAIPPLPADLGPDRPIPVPAPLAEGRGDPRQGIHFGLGFPLVRIHADALGVKVTSGRPVATGVLMHVEGVWDPFRLGYARHLYRGELPPDTELDGLKVDALSFDADQVWVFHGFRPYHSVYLGYGLGLQHRRIRVLSGGAAVRAVTDASMLGGVLADWALALPFTLELRVFGDVNADVVRAVGASLQLAYTAGF